MIMYCCDQGYCFVSNGIMFVRDLVQVLMTELDFLLLCLFIFDFYE